MASSLGAIPARLPLSGLDREARRLARPNILLLTQAFALVDRIDDALFTSPSPIAPGGSVGRHLRHCIDFYECFLRGFRNGAIDYSARQRDFSVETSRDRALIRLHEITRGLGRLHLVELDRTVLTKAESDIVGEEAAAWSRSTIHRELQFLLSHTIHHFALIAMLLRTLGFVPPEDFGVAPSTLDHWAKEGRIAAEAS